MKLIQNILKMESISSSKFENFFFNGEDDILTLTSKLF